MKTASLKALEERLITTIGTKAYHLFESGQLWCSETVLVTLNQGLGGGLSPQIAAALTVGMGDGIGGGGCLCGALNGAVVALGLFLAGCDASERTRSKTIRAHAKDLKKAFNSRFGTTCCRILKQKHHNKKLCCAEQTAFMAEFAARIILKRRPKLIESADFNYLNQRYNHTTDF